MKAKKESIVLSVILLCLILIAVGMSYAFLKTSFFGSKTSVLKVGSLSLILDETSGNAITVEDGNQCMIVKEQNKIIILLLH